MKKLLLSFILIAAITGCNDYYGRDSTGVAHADNKYKTYTVIPIEAKNEIHEYLIYNHGDQGGITHLPNCKYCKERKLK